MKIELDDLYGLLIEDESNDAQNAGVEFRIEVDDFDIETHVLSYGGKEVHMISCGIYAPYELNELLEALCRMSPDYCHLERAGSNYADIDRCLSKFYVIKHENGEATWSKEYKPCRQEDVYNVEVPDNIFLKFGAESVYTEWKLQRELSGDNNFNVNIHVSTETGTYIEELDFKVSYAELCKAIADGCTNAWKEHGVFGWEAGNFSNFPNLKMLLFIKAVGYNRLDDMKVVAGSDGKMNVSSFHKELSLLLL